MTSLHTFFKSYKYHKFDRTLQNLEHALWKKNFFILHVEKQIYKSRDVTSTTYNVHYEMIL